jgi:SSS family transporter
VPLTAVDYAVVAVYLAAITLFGAWFARFQRSTATYFLADRSAPWWAICCTVVATETSTLSFIGVPALAYAGNMVFLQLALGYVIGRVLVSAIFLPAYFRGALVTSYELLHRRFGAGVKTAAAGLFLITRSLADGIRLFATALVVTVVTGVPVPWTVTALGAAMIVYTVRGGAAAVIWTDVVQMFVYLGGALLVMWGLLVEIPGGWSTVVSVATEAGKFTWLDRSTDPHAIYTIWAGVAGGLALTLATHGTDQFLVQRLLAARSARQAGAALTLSGVLVFAQFTHFLLIGIMLYVRYQSAPPDLGRTDEILPYFVVQALSGGTAGVIVAAIVAAALSPSLNAMAATTVNDFYRVYRPGADERTLLAVARRWTIVWGIVQVGVALAAQALARSVLDAGLAVLSLTAGPILGAFLVGVSTRRVGSKPMLAGMACGFSVLLWLWWTSAIAWTWYALSGATLTAATALALHLAGWDRRGDV